jgi:hypothetical protein
MCHGGRGHEFETRHPLHFGCVHALRGHATWCWWSGMCAILGQTTCSETPRPTGRSRLGTAEVEPSPRGSAGRAAAAASGRPRVQSGAGGRQQPCRVRLDGRGHHPFKVGTRVRIPHATPEQETSVELTLRGWKPAATIGRRRNPSPDGSSGGVAQHPVEQPPCKRQAAGSNPVTSTTWPGLVNSAARVPACLAGSRGFDSRTRRQSQSPR